MTPSLPLLGLLSSFALSTALGGCSFAFVDGPPTEHKRMPYFECTSSRAWPTVDVVLGGVSGIEAVAFAADNRLSSGKTEAIISAGEAALFIASAVYGYQKASTCREAKEELMIRLYRQQARPGFGGPQPAPYDPWLAPPPGAFAPPRGSSSTEPEESEPAAAPSPPAPANPKGPQ